MIKIYLIIYVLICLKYIFFLNVTYSSLNVNEQDEREAKNITDFLFIENIASF